MRYWPSSLLFSTFPLYFSSSAPCPPRDVAVDAQCADGAMIVSWSPNPDAQYFIVEAMSNTGSRHHCNSSGTACIIRNLPCGQNYNVTVLSVRDGCDSEPSTMFETSSGKLQAVRLLICQNAKILSTAAMWKGYCLLCLTLEVRNKCIFHMGQCSVIVRQVFPTCTTYSML